MKNALAEMVERIKHLRRGIMDKSPFARHWNHCVDDVENILRDALSGGAFVDVIANRDFDFTCGNCKMLTASMVNVPACKCNGRRIGTDVLSRPDWCPAFVWKEKT